MPKIIHLKGITSRFVETSRLKTHLLTAGEPENDAILFLHGNTCCSAIWEEFMLRFSDSYFCIAPDLRGFGETDNDKIIDAARGTLDWIDDLTALTDALKISSFHLIGHSLGGFAGWSMIANHPQKVRTATLIAPGPPMGFGGLKEKTGEPNNEDFSGSGAGIVNKKFAKRIIAKDRSTEDALFSPRNAMNRLFWKEGFKAEHEEAILESMLSIHTGDQNWPGDFTTSTYWPGVSPGKFGPVNALSPKYNQSTLNQLLRVEKKPPLLWIHGNDDNIVSNHSYSDPGFQGQMGLLKKWPGNEAFPPQPMLSQIKYAVDEYQSSGGAVYKTFIDDCGHSPFIEKPEETFIAVKRHLQN